MSRPQQPPFSPSWLRFIVRHPFAVLLVTALITAVLAWRLPSIRFETSLYDMAIEDLPETRAYQAFKDRFGSEEIILVVVRAEDVFDPKTFREMEGLARSVSGIPGVRRVISLPGIKKEMDLTGGWDVDAFKRAIQPVELFTRNLVSEDHTATVITLVLEDVNEKGGVVREVEGLIEARRNGLSLYQIGMPLVSRALAEYTEADFLRLPPVTFLVIAVILFLFFRNLRGVLVPAGSVLLALAWTFGLMAWTGTPLSMLTMIVPIFIIAVGTAYCMYVLPEYFEALGENPSPGGAVVACFARLSFPTILAVTTTTVGLGSLLLNRIQSIREFALFACFGIWSMLAIILVVLPAFLSLLPMPRRSTVPPDETGRGLLSRLLDAVVRLNLEHQRWTLAMVSVLALIGLAGVFQIGVETNPVGYFKPHTEVTRRFHDIYRDMAGSFPVNIVLDSGAAGYFEDP
ncbi:MAG: MMPL family transporter, partial [Deltaproteobacteria bacterium]|nr:MMPL family transporter [Deltaproteobacteria bacterium]